MTAVAEPTTRTGSLLRVLPKVVYVCDAGVIHTQNGAQTGCYLGPLRPSGLYLPASLHPLREWCPRCFPGPRCTSRRCQVPAGGSVCQFCLAKETATDKRLERAS